MDSSRRGGRSLLRLGTWLWEEIELDDDYIMDLIVRSTFEKERWVHRRVDWDYHVQKKIHEKMFVQTYRMSYRAFCKLQLMLASNLRRSASKSRVLVPVPLHSIVAIGVRYLAGAKYQDLMDVHGCSRTEVFRCIDAF